MMIIIMLKCELASRIYNYNQELLKMGRKKIEIKLIKNDRLRNITYNKRKRGLLKKLVELSIMCGIKAKLQMRDSFGNLIVLDAGRQAKPESDEDKDKVFVFTPADYPEFKGFERIKRRGAPSQVQQGQSKEQTDRDQNQFQKKSEEFQEFKPSPQQSAPHDPIAMQRAESCPLPKDTNLSVVAPVAIPGVDYVRQLQNWQAMQLHSQLEYAALSYKSLLNGFMNGQNI